MITIAELQTRLRAMGFYSGAIDGIIGAQTLGALDILTKENTSSKPSDFWSEIHYFTRHEKNIPCPCCGKEIMQSNIMLAADELRGILNVPGIVTSGTRCEKHNKAVGGVSNSYHLFGKAVDITFPGIPADTVLKVAKSLPGIHYAYKIDDYTIHMDAD